MACSIASSQAERLEVASSEIMRRAENNGGQVGLQGTSGTPPPRKKTEQQESLLLISSIRIAVLIGFTLLPASSTVAAEPLQFKATQLDDAHEGYFTLSWNAYPRAVEYQVMAADGQSVYRGPLPKAFISGLVNGSYEYRVKALDARGQVLATTAIPAVVEVDHWSLRLALTLLCCGFAVFLAVVGLIVRGTWQTRSQPAAPSESTSSAHRGEPK